ncbi:MAG TPA: DUF3108 domain-containing protein [Noviherbaspirillum sp.]|nr:DUF3108 domain-containing protein [Noviherbaspirillum sp.]
MLPAALLASLLWHLFLFNWANGRIVLPGFRSEPPAVITTELLPPPVAKAEPAPKPKSKPVRKPTPRPAAPPPPQVTETAAISSPDTSVAVTEPAQAVETEPVAAAPEAGETAPQVGDPAGNLKFDLPPSAELKYEVQALRDGKQWYGTGVFQWDAADRAYVINGEASISILFKITVLNFRSEGAVNEFGIAPVLYSEKPWRKAMTNTHFQHGKISFSASQAEYPYKGGEQDRASIIWQLAGIGRGDPGQFVAGTAFDIMVAGARNADTWRIDVVGQEEIETPHGTMSAWHVVRSPKPGSYDQKIDIWLAPLHEWYPAKVRYTYANGDWLDMVLAELTPRSPAIASSGNE